MSFEDFVICTTASPVGEADDSLTIVAQSPYRTPKEPLEGVGRLTISDSARSPSELEVISYSSVTETTPGTVVLGGVERGQEGTTAKNWPSGSFACQDVLSRDLKMLELQEPVPWIVVGSTDTTIRRFRPDGTPSWINDDKDSAVVAVAAAEDGTYRALEITGKVSKINSAGETLWVSSGVAPGWYTFLAASPAGETFYGTVTSADVATLVAFNADGSVKWSKTLGSTMTGMDCDQSGNVFVLSAFSLLKILPDGTVAWERQDIAAPGSINRGSSLSCPGNGRIYAATDSGIFVLNGSGGTEKFIRIYATVISANHSGQILFFDSSSLGLLNADDSVAWEVDLPVRGGSVPRIALGDNGFGVMSGVFRTVDVISVEDGSTAATLAGFFSNATAVALFNPSPALFSGYTANGPALRRPNAAELVESPFSESLLFEEAAEPVTPPADHAWLYFEDRALKAKFSNGTVVTIASAT